MNGEIDPLALDCGHRSTSTLRILASSTATPARSIGMMESTEVVASSNSGSGSNFCTNAHTYASAGVYTVRMTITDDDLRAL